MRLTLSRLHDLSHGGNERAQGASPQKTAHARNEFAAGNALGFQQNKPLIAYDGGLKLIVRLVWTDTARAFIM